MSYMRAAAFAVLFWACTASADGKIFSPVMPIVNIPDQSAPICFDGSTELLVIETAFDAAGSDFAWVVPLPSIPRFKGYRGASSPR